MSVARNVILCILLHFATPPSAIGVMMTMPRRVAVPIASAAACCGVGGTVGGRTCVFLGEGDSSMDGGGVTERRRSHNKQRKYV